MWHEMCSLGDQMQKTQSTLSTFAHCRHCRQSLSISGKLERFGRVTSWVLPARFQWSYCSFPSQWQTHVTYKTSVVDTFAVVSSAPWSFLELYWYWTACKLCNIPDLNRVCHIGSSLSQKTPFSIQISVTLRTRDIFQRGCFVTFCVGKWRTSMWWNIQSILWCA